MFVDITEEKKPLEAERIYNRCYRGKEEITPEICLAVLRATNYAACVRRMLLCVEKLPVEKQGAFKEAVLATFTNREQPDDVAEIGERLAAASGYKEELSAAINEPDLSKKLYIHSSPDYRTDEIYTNKLACYGKDMRRSHRVIFDSDVAILSRAVNLPKVIDVRQCSHVLFEFTDLAGVEEILFKDGADVNFARADNLPAGLDVSRCDVVCFTGCDLTKVKPMRLKEGCLGNFLVAKLPEELDVSGCRRIDLTHSYTDGMKKITFANIDQWIESRLEIPDEWDGDVVCAKKNCEKKRETGVRGLWARITGKGR